MEIPIGHGVQGGWEPRADELRIELLRGVGHFDEASAVIADAIAESARDADELSTPPVFVMRGNPDDADVGGC